MKLHKAIKKVNDEKDIEALMPLYHEDVVVDPWMHPVQSVTFELYESSYLHKLHSESYSLIHNIGGIKTVWMRSTGSPFQRCSSGMRATIVACRSLYKDVL